MQCKDEPAFASGEITYIGPDGAATGRELFELITSEGSNVLRAWCRMDDIDLERHVALSMDVKWRPLLAFSRVASKRGIDAATWFKVTADSIAITGSVAGRAIDHVVRTDRHCPYLGLHPLQGDALIVQQRGDHDPGQFLTINGLTNSISPNGDLGLEGYRVEIDVAFIGEEVVNVLAGSFKARRYALRWKADWPAADLWVRRQDCVFLRLQWEFTGCSYELSKLVEGAWIDRNRLTLLPADTIAAILSDLQICGPAIEECSGC